MISQLGTDLLNKIKALPSGALGTAPVRVGLAVGATSIDPFMEKVKLPAAWAVYVGDINTSTDAQGQCGGTVVAQFVLKVLVEYTNEKDLLDNQYPLLREITKQINGQMGPLGAMRWKYEGQTLDELTGNRAVFDQRYSIVTTL